MTWIKNYYNSSDILTNVRVAFPFNSELQGWRIVEDSLVLKGKSIDEIAHASKWVIDYKDNPDEFPINSNFFRSDEFKDKHEGKHILFSGCSVTYGIGLYTKETWSYLLYDKIKKNEKVSGYYNLGTPGTSIFDIVFNVFKYIKKYGNPDVIFIDLPDLNRFYALLDSFNGPFKWQDKIEGNPLDFIKNNFFHASQKPNAGENFSFVYEKLIYTYQYLSMLETYCKNNNIKLFLFSYIGMLEHFLSMTDISRYYQLKSSKIDQLVYDYHQQNKDDKFYLIARDNAHPGTGQHHAWAELMYEIYLGDKNVN